MGPWDIIGWAIVAVVVLRLAWGVAYVTLGEVRLWRARRLRRRADAGKVTCQHVVDIVEDDTVWPVRRCRNIATRRTPNGYFCDDHWREHSRTGSISFAIPLDYTKGTK
jgi:hypothetical protein